MNKMEKIISLAKRRGFIYPGSEIYGGLAGVWDWGPIGVLLKNNVKNSWWKKFVLDRDDTFGLDSSILLNSKVWEASGHLKNFSDELAECKKCHKRFRTIDGGLAVCLPVTKPLAKCPNCGGELTEPKQFNTMFKTFIGADEDTVSQIYLRPETAQGMFVNFKNIVDSFHPKIPFGIAQIGKAFRNEIAPSDFIFRTREFEQMEIEYFISPPTGGEWQKHFEYWLKQTREWLGEIGLNHQNISEREVKEGDRAHYSKRTIDIDYEYPFGKEELCGIAYRTDFDLKAHNLNYYDEKTKEIFIPYVIEPSFGVERTVLALLRDAYNEDEMNGEQRTVLKLKPEIAPIKAAIFPLLKNKPDLVNKAREVYKIIKKNIQPVVFDDNDNIGKRYRRQDEIGTPWCITIDFETLEDNTATIRARDTGKQERVDIRTITEYIQKG